MKGLEIEKTYFEQHGDELLATAGLSKVQFAQAMGIKAQNVGKMIATKNVLSLMKVAEVLNVPFPFLVNGPKQKALEIHGCIYINGNPTLISSKEELEEVLKSL